MVKRVTSCLLLLVLLFTFTNVFANDGANLEDSIVEPMGIPCDY